MGKNVFQFTVQTTMLVNPLFF